jgi:hypothetical protein
MESSSLRFKSFAVTAGLSFWFFVILSSTGFFKIEIWVIFAITVLIITQVFSTKIVNALDIFAMINTKIFLTIIFGIVISIYGVLFRLLRIDLLRLKKQEESYWLEKEKNNYDDVRKQY